MVLQSLVMLLLISILIFRQSSVGLRTFVVPGHGARDTKAAIRFFFTFFMASMALGILIIGLIALVSRLMGHDPSGFIRVYEQGIEQESSSLLSRRTGWIGILPIILLGPPVEEILFRGCLYGALRKKFLPWQANLMSSTLFALGHTYFFGFPNVLLLGILCAYAYERTRSLRTPILFHMFWNTSCMAFVKPELWLVLGVILLCLFLWSRRADAGDSEPGLGAIPKAKRRLGWKIYAWVFLFLSILSYAAESGEAWEALLEIPAYIGVFAYAYDWRLFRREFWAAYGLFYVCWVVGQMSDSMHHMLLVQTLTTTAVMFASTFFLIIPSVLAVWRLASRVDASKSAVLE